MEQTSTPSLDDLRAFLRIAQDGSFSKASQHLGVPKATLSRRLAQLERDLGVPLLVRTTRSVQVTEAGRAFLPEAAAVLAALDDATARVREAGGPPRGRLRIAARVGFGVGVLSPLLAEFALREPAVDLEVELTDREVDLVYEGFDLALQVGPRPDPVLAARRLGALQHGLYASPAYLAARGRPRYAHELAEHPALQSTGLDDGPRWTLTDGAQTLTVPIRPRIRANDDRVLRDAAVAGLGIALCSTPVAEPEVVAGRLERLLPSFGAPEVPVHAVFPSERFLIPRVRSCVEFLVARFAARDAE
jgi:LysR family transcriptional regulator for bpeEF and oprC